MFRYQTARLSLFKLGGASDRTGDRSKAWRVQKSDPRKEEVQARAVITLHKPAGRESSLCTSRPVPLSCSTVLLNGLMHLRQIAVGRQGAT